MARPGAGWVVALAAAIPYLPLLPFSSAAAQVAAGQYVVARDGHFYLGDQRIRFWGVNATPRAYLDCRHHLDMFAQRVGALGFNAVRAHYFLNQSYVYGADLSKREFVPYTKGDGSVWDGLDYLISRYKQLGIYCYGTEVLGPLPLTPEAYDILPDDGTREPWQAAVAKLDLQSGVNPLPWALAYFDDRIAAVKLKHWRNILDHVNQYTGKRYAEDEVFALWQTTNETAGSVFGIVLDDPKYTHQMPEFFVAEVRRLWNDYLQRKYGAYPRLRAAWGPAAAGQALGAVSLPWGQMKTGQVKLEPAVYADLIAFGMERWEKHSAECVALIRSLAPPGVGCNVVPICTGATPNPVLPMAWASASGDFVAANDYHFMLTADRRDPLYPWRSRLSETPVLHSGLWLGVKDKPFVVYEGNVHKPAPYRAEYPLFDALAGCWQDYDGLFLHSLYPVTMRDDEPWTEPLGYAYNGEWKSLFDGCLFWTDEIFCAAVRTAGEVFRQGLISPAPQPTTVTVGKQAIFDPKYYWFGRMSWDERQTLADLEWTQGVCGGRLRYDPAWDGKIRVEGRSAVHPYAAVTWGRGPQVRWDWPQGQMVVDTPRCNALAGFSFQRHQFGTGVSVAGLNRPFVSFVLVSQDGAPIATSRRLLCSCVSTGENTGLRVDPTKMEVRPLAAGGQWLLGGESLKAMILSPGTAPVDIKRVSAEVSLPRLPGRICRKLDFAFRRLSEEPAETGFTLREGEPMYVCELTAP
ncbi:MAG: hypothetical protein KKI08_26315 [Armatimonadetes bacterium]|nr:hypothetical protein [Armatimonadota bacterium]